MKNITRKSLNLIQKIGATPIILKLARIPAINSLHAFWDKQSSDSYHNQYVLLRNRLDKAHLTLSGLSVLEVGSGGSIGMGYFFIADGCKSWLATDLFSDLLTDKKWMKNEKKIVQEVSEKYWPKATLFVSFQKDNIIFKKSIKFKKLDITHFDKSLDGAFDVIISQAVLEHVDGDQIPKAIKNLSKYLKKGGYMIHEIDLRDHINVLNPINFYRYKGNVWNKMTHGTIFYTNRLRASDYEREFNRNGLKEVYSDSTIEKLPKKFPITIDFQNYSKADLSTTIIFSILTKIK